MKISQISYSLSLLNLVLQIYTISNYTMDVDS